MTKKAKKLTKVSVPELDKILGKKFPVLDDGFIRVIDYMGSDEAIVQAARVSYGKGTKKVSKDRGLIRYLMRHRHTTPFEMCEIKLHVRVPMDTWRQWIRHRTANVNEYSTRYSVAIDSMQQTPFDGWRQQSGTNKQGSGDNLKPVDGIILSTAEADFQRKAREVYESRLEMGVAREQARKDLPLSTYTEAYWKIDLHNLLHFLSLRMDSHAQYEIRQYATIIGEEIVSKWVPHTWEAFLDYVLNAETLSAIEAEYIRLWNTSDFAVSALSFLIEKGLLKHENPGDLAKETFKSTRELDELELKLLRLGMPIPWEHLLV